MTGQRSLAEMWAREVLSEVVNGATGIAEFIAMSYSKSE